MEKNSNQSFKMSDGFNVSCRKWDAIGQVQRVVLCLHGIESHSGAFLFFGSELSQVGTQVYAFDRRGFGNSVEETCHRGDASNFNRHLEDLNDVVSIVRQNHPSKKLFLFGHSIGCAYALWYAAHYPDSVDGLVLAAPPVIAGFKLPAKYAIELPLESVFEPHSTFDLLDVWPQAFRESEEYQLLTQDPLCTKNFGTNWLINVQTKLANKMLQNASKINKPTLIIHGDADIIALPKSSNQLMEHLQTQDKTLQTFPGADHWFYHALIPTPTTKYTDVARKTVSKIIVEWINKH